MQGGGDDNMVFKSKKGIMSNPILGCLISAISLYVLYYYFAIYTEHSTPGLTLMFAGLGVFAPVLQLVHRSETFSVTEDRIIYRRLGDGTKTILFKELVQVYKMKVEIKNPSLFLLIFTSKDNFTIEVLTDLFNGIEQIETVLTYVKDKNPNVEFQLIE